MATQTKKITLDSAALFLGRVLGLLIGMVRLNYLATYLGVANFGILNFALYFCSLFQVLFDLGTTQLLTRDLARDPSRSREYVGKALFLKAAVVFGAGGIVGSIGFISHFENITNWAILLTTGVFALNGMSNVFLGAFQAHRKMHFVFLYNILNDLLLSALIILLIRQNPYVMTVLLLSILVAGVNFIMLLVLYIRTIGAPLVQLDWKFGREFLKQSTPIAVSSLGISIYTFIGPTVLKYSRGNVEVGLYSAGYKIVSILALLPNTFSQVIYPVFSDFYANAREKLGKALEDSVRVMAEVAIPIGFGVSILAPKVIALLFPPTYADASKVLQIGICADALVYLVWIVYIFLLSADHPVTCMKISIGVALLSLAGNLIFVPMLGYMGVVYVLLGSDIVLFCAYVYAAVRLGYSIGRPSVFARIFLAATVMGVALYFLQRWSLIPSIVISGGIYFAVLFALNVPGDQERESIVKFLKRFQNA